MYISLVTSLYVYQGIVFIYPLVYILLEIVRKCLYSILKILIIYRSRNYCALFLQKIIALYFKMVNMDVLLFDKASDYSSLLTNYFVWMIKLDSRKKMYVSDVSMMYK